MTEDLYGPLIAVRKKGSAADGQTVRSLLAHAMQRFDVPIDDHAVWWNGQAWGGASPWSKPVRQRVRALYDSLHDQSRDDGWRLIARSDVFERADDPFDLFVAAMAWGFGDRGYGWHRTALIVNSAGEARIRQAVEDMHRVAVEHDYGAVWRSWSRGGIAKLPGLDTAFASKLAYFASFDRRECRGPLIADLNTTWALWALAGIWDSRKSASLYGQYVAWAERQAHDLTCRPDEIERALFAIGPGIRREWKRQQQASAGAANAQRTSGKS